MSRRVAYALIILALSVIVLLFNRGTVSVDLLFTTVDAMKSLAFLAFIGVGVVIGVLLK